jgi:hypothetical protein
MSIDPIFIAIWVVIGRTAGKTQSQRRCELAGVKTWADLRNALKHAHDEEMGRRVARFASRSPVFLYA